MQEKAATFLSQALDSGFVSTVALQECVGILYSKHNFLMLYVLAAMVLGKYCLATVALENSAVSMNCKFLKYRNEDY